MTQQMETGRKCGKDKTCVFFCLLFFLFGILGLSAQTVVVQGGEIHSMDGEILASGTILIREGRIVEIGEEISVPKDATIVLAEGYMLYPGLVASSGLFTLDELKNFESYAPDASAADRFDFHGDYTPYIRGGVTSAFVGVPGNRIISGKGMVVKLGQGNRLSTMLKNDVVVCINLGKNAVLPPMTDIFPAPVSVENPLIPSFKQFPSSSLGAFWLLQTLFRAETYSGDLAKYFQNVSDALNKARKQEIPVIVKAQDDVDIGQAIRFAESVRMPLIVRGIPVSPSLIRLLKERDIPVVAEVNFQPDGMAEPADSAHAERGRLRMKNIPLMIDQGLRIALTATDEEVLPDLFWAAQYFRSHGRISAEKIIETITINPAEIFGVGDRIGSLASGKDADILFFKKKPGLPFPVLEKVMSQGRMVYEKK